MDKVQARPRLRLSLQAWEDMEISDSDITSKIKGIALIWIILWEIEDARIWLKDTLEGNLLWT